MKKIFLYVMIAFMGFVSVSCENGSNQGKNPYPYLRLSDIAPLHLIPLSKAEAKLAEMGFKNGEVHYGYYCYFSEDKLEQIECTLDADGIVEAVYYISTKDISPVEAKGWFTHIPETVKLPNYSKSIPFDYAEIYDMDSRQTDTIQNYTDYSVKIENLTIGKSLYGHWWKNDCDYRVEIIYSNYSGVVAYINILPL